MTKETREYIDLTPTWSALVPVMCAVLSSPDTDIETKRDIERQIARMAEVVDEMNAHNKAKREGGETE